MKTKYSIRYSEAFKRQVVDQIESGKFSCAADAARSYQIKGTATIYRWLRRYGSEKIIPKQIKIMSREEVDQTQQLKKRVRELESALSTAHMQGLLNESYLEIACERIGTDIDSFKKKHATTLSGSRQGKAPR